MKISSNSNVPIFIQISNLIEEQILNGTFTENNQIISTNELSSLLNVNPITILKGINLLVDQNILYKKRGLGIFVSENALSIIMENRSSEFKKNYVDSLVAEAKKLNISEDDLIQQIKNSYENEEDL